MYDIHIAYRMSAVCVSTQRVSDKELFVCNVVTLARESPGGTAWWQKETEMLHCLMAADRINPQQCLGKHCCGNSHWLKMLKGNALWEIFAKLFMTEMHDGFHCQCFQRNKVESYNRPWLSYWSTDFLYYYYYYFP